jgi:phosphohistidine phosphatase
MELYFLRHAIAVDCNVSMSESDSERPLSKDGIKKMQKIARGMHSLELSFDLIYGSPYRRARETAEIVAREFGLRSSLRFTPYLEPSADPKRFVKYLQGQKGRAQSILLVGHEPFLSSVVSLLVSGEEKLNITLKKGGLCKLRAERLRSAKCGSLEWLLTPRHLMRIRSS